VPQEISLEEKRVYVSTPMIHELIHSMPMQECISPTFEAGSSSATPNVNGAPVIQEPEVPNVVIDDEEEQPQNIENNVPNQENIRRSQRVRKSAIPDDYCHTRFLRPKPDAHRMYAQDQVVIHTVRM
jgi:hypothetical protein